MAKEKSKSEEILKSPFDQVAGRLREAKQNLEQDGLTDDASHIDGIIGNLESAGDGDFNARIELWDGESNNSDKVGWYPAEKTKKIIFEALGTNYSGSNSQFDDLDINYNAGQFNKDNV